jgi:DDE superfamily endonuclease
MSIETLTEQILRKMPQTNKWQRDFFIHLLGVLMRLRGRYTFVNLARHGDRNEMTYRNRFRSGFDFARFNRLLIERCIQPRNRLLVFDPCHIRKSGKQTPGLGYFYSSTAGKAQRGLELCAFACVDTNSPTNLHYLALQTLPAPQTDKPNPLLHFYGQQVLAQADGLRQLSRYLAVDAFFSKKGFVDTVHQRGLWLISRMRSDAVVFLPPPQRLPGQKGRPRKYGRRLDYSSPDALQGQLPLLERSGQASVYGGLVRVRSLDRLVQLSVVFEADGKGGYGKAKLCFCTNLEFDPARIWPCYRRRFGIEFLFRDAKQHTGLQHCQSRQPASIAYQFNTSLTAVSMARAAQLLQVDKTADKATAPVFSMADVKTRQHNRYLIDSVFERFAHCPNLTKNHPDIVRLYQLGIINT